MAKLSAFCGLIALFALLGVANAHVGHNFYITGKVYCDNCATGFPTRISPAISGATVGVECKDPGKRLFYNEQHTDNDGLFSIVVLGEHEHEACEAFTVSSPTSRNLKTDSSRGPVYLTHNNGINSDERKTGPFAFRIFVLAFITESFLLTTNRMGACGRRMVVNLEILEAKNVIVKLSGGRDSLFVRYYLTSGNGDGDNNIAVNSREVMAKASPEWKQTFRLECAGSIGDCNVICELQKQFVRFELRERSSRIRVLGNMFRASKLVGWVEIAWKDLLASPTLSINYWFPLIPFNTIISGGSQPPPSLHVAISIKPLILVYSVSQPPKEYRTEMEIYDPQVNEIRQNRCIRRVEWSNCRCGGKVAAQVSMERVFYLSYDEQQQQ